MAIDTARRRRSAVHHGLPFLRTLPFPDTQVSVEDRYLVAGFYVGIIPTVPEQLDQLPNRSAESDTGTYQYDLSVFFSGANSYSIAPALEVGWSFDTNTGILEIDTDADGTFGPYTVTATNAAGNTDGNAFTVSVATSNIRLSTQGPMARIKMGLRYGRF